MKTVCSLISPVVRVHEPGGHEQRAGVGHVPLPALLLGVLGRVEDVVGQLELQRRGEVLDRRDVGEDLGDPLLDEVVERLPLDRDEVREGKDLREMGKERRSRDARRGKATPQDLGARGERAGRSAVKRAGRHG